MAEIVFLQGPFTGHKLELPSTGVVLGRSKEADLVINDEQISGRHAQLSMQEGAWHIIDLQSSNGTTVNGNPAQTHLLNDGDVVGIGDTLFSFSGNGAPAEAIMAEPAPESSPAEVETAPIAATAARKAQSGGDTGASEEDVDLVRQMSRRADAIRNEVGKVIVGQRDVLDQVLMCIIAGGHALLIGLPGMAKTLMVSTIAKVLNMQFKRVQFTPDLMPTDIIGSDVLETNKETGEKEFRFIKGPIFCNMLLADEINRTPPKTQAALLEAMQEKRVTAGNTTYTLDKPFFVLATQNPIEQEGTYPLPEAQLDRFMFNIWVDYPLQHEEEQIIGSTTTGNQAEPQTILSKEEVIQLQQVVKKIPVSDHVVKYVIKLVRATRPGNEESPEITRKYVSNGAGPRAGQNMVLAAKAMAVLEGRIHVSCNDIRRAAIPVLRHRIGTNFAADSEGLTSMDIVARLLAEVQEPGEEAYTPSSSELVKKAGAEKKKDGKKR
ncbi:MAG: AAA family ATPase [Lentisphaerae bacterium]|nr:AAA family ATPase [Lentisphaerota bacterium]